MIWLREDPERMEHFKETVIKYVTEKNEEMGNVVEDNSDDYPVDETGAKYDPETGEVFEDLEESEK